MDSFYDGFCKVEFLCYLGEPNWLGWMVIGIGIGIGAIVIGIVLLGILLSIE